jgi:hypothetical protein
LLYDHWDKLVDHSSVLVKKRERIYSTGTATSLMMA